ncbi:MAG: hypothetical protein UT42_C0019G0015 [Candidatus Falkowbacteria bacterium GW2011_GWA2_39_24]|uniref:Uncharacterized protein n=1 Tax=Candidatus Falkowbacteria bacterium GW2011_GWA2_39_24 TaxID=1618634 RepID=A0A0G0NF59_9BACT|nr:MAG: hypothetical protein UT42_C0019G0015 [Candidatus Falkowbacteria bacterium GW2011_GWA2_39_24]
MINIQGNRKIFGILIIVLGLVLLGVIVYFIFFHDFDKSASGPDGLTNISQLLSPDQSTVQDFTQTSQTTNEPVMTTAELSQEGVKQIAASFAERLGSWSNQANASNLVDLKLMMTPSLQEWANDQIVQTKTNTKDYQEYYGITTRAVTTEAQSFTDSQATILINTQRTEVKQGQTRTFNQALKLELVKAGKTWLVDGAYWQ